MVGYTPVIDRKKGSFLCGSDPSKNARDVAGTLAHVTGGTNTVLSDDSIVLDVLFVHDVTLDTSAL